MCDVKRWDGAPLLHVHCSARNFSGRRCNIVTLADPCGLCMIQGRGPGGAEPEPKPEMIEPDETEY